MKKYKLEIEIVEGNDEFWEKHIFGTGCNEVKELVVDMLAGEGLVDGDNCTVKLVEFTDRS